MYLSASDKHICKTQLLSFNLTLKCDLKDPSFIGGGKLYTAEKF